MERLTERGNPMLDGNKIREHVSELYWRLKKYEDMEENGTLIYLPFKVGETLYDISEFVHDDSGPEMYELDSSNIHIYKAQDELIFTVDCADFTETDLKKCLFTSEDKAWDEVGKLYKNGVRVK